MGALFRALIGAHFHLAKLRAKRAAPEDPVNDGYRRWGTRLERLSSRRCRLLERVTSVTSIEDTVCALREHSEKQLGVSHPLWRHATAALAEAHGITVRREDPKDPPFDALADHIARSLNGSCISLQDVEQKPNGMAMSLAALGALSARTAGDKAEADRMQRFAQDAKDGTDHSIHVTEAGMDGDGVTRFAAEVTHRPPEDETFAKVATEADPRNWSKVFPGMFAKSYRIRDASECVDRYEDPDPDDAGDTLGKNKDWFGPLFETAQFALGGTPLIVFRNVLDVKFKVRENDAKNGEINIDYCLHEALSNSILDFGNPGGLDVDSAAPGTCQVILNGSKEIMTTKAAKNLRFSEDAEFSEELNVLALPFIQTWITQLLIASMKL